MKTKIHDAKTVAFIGMLAALMFEAPETRTAFLGEVVRYNELCCTGRFGFQYTTSLPGQSIRAWPRPWAGRRAGGWPGVEQEVQHGQHHCRSRSFGCHDQCGSRSIQAEEAPGGMELYGRL